MALELEGTLRQKLGVQSGTSARGQWAKQEFILEFPDGNFTAQACFTAWGQDKVAELDKYQVGDKIKVSFNLKAREYNGRWYNDLQIWRISPAGAAAPTAPGAPAYPAQGAPSFPAQTGNPAPAAPTYEAPAPTLDDMPGEDSEDLPF
ncbi:MAG: DUF3127 domain-containing protein [Candidatus Cryptobacteroides sp.]|nr:DUF3127 domain-containing protein [Candidatus Cryptobacteroides sp.]MEE3466277.1 DUF3127 domain-containing protein [Candidatus Cryptobacteroides sp.]